MCKSCQGCEMPKPKTLGQINQLILCEIKRQLTDNDGVNMYDTILEELNGMCFDPCKCELGKYVKDGGLCTTETEDNCPVCDGSGNNEQSPLKTKPPAKNKAPREWRECTRCDGSGRATCDGKKTKEGKCSKCKAEKWRPMPVPEGQKCGRCDNGKKTHTTEEECRILGNDCAKCSGTGRKDKQGHKRRPSNPYKGDGKCRVCGGSGRGCKWLYMGKCNRTRPFHNDTERDAGAFQLIKDGRIEAEVDGEWVLVKIKKDTCIAQEEIWHIWYGDWNEEEKAWNKEANIPFNEVSSRIRVLEGTGKVPKEGNEGRLTKLDLVNNVSAYVERYLPQVSNLLLWNVTEIVGSTEIESILKNLMSRLKTEFKPLIEYALKQQESKGNSSWQKALRSWKTWIAGYVEQTNDDAEVEDGLNGVSDRKLAEAVEALMNVARDKITSSSSWGDMLFSIAATLGRAGLGVDVFGLKSLWNKHESSISSVLNLARGWLYKALDFIGINIFEPRDCIIDKLNELFAQSALMVKRQAMKDTKDKIEETRVETDTEEERTQKRKLKSYNRRIEFMNRQYPELADDERFEELCKFRRKNACNCESDSDSPSPVSAILKYLDMSSPESIIDSLKKNICSNLDLLGLGAVDPKCERCAGEGKAAEAQHPNSNPGHLVGNEEWHAVQRIHEPRAFKIGDEMELKVRRNNTLVLDADGKIRLKIHSGSEYRSNVSVPVKVEKVNGDSTYNVRVLDNRVAKIGEVLPHVPRKDLIRIKVKFLEGNFAGEEEIMIVSESEYNGHIDNRPINLKTDNEEQLIAAHLVEAQVDGAWVLVNERTMEDCTTCTSDDGYADSDGFVCETCDGTGKNNGTWQVWWFRSRDGEKCNAKIPTAEFDNRIRVLTCNSCAGSGIGALNAGLSPLRDHMKVLLDHILGDEACQLIVELLKSHAVAALQDVEDVLMPALMCEFKAAKFTNLLDIIRSMESLGLPFYIKGVLWFAKGIVHLDGVKGIVHGVVQDKFDGVQTKLERYIDASWRTLLRANERYKDAERKFDLIPEAEKEESKRKLKDFGIYEDEINVNTKMVTNKDDIKSWSKMKEILQSSKSAAVNINRIKTNRKELIRLLAVQLGTTKRMESIQRIGKGLRSY